MYKKCICSERPITICAIVKNWLSKGSQIWPRCDVSRRQKQLGLSYPLRYRKSSAPTFAECNFCAIHLSLVVYGLVSYPLVLFQLGFSIPISSGSKNTTCKCQLFKHISCTKSNRTNQRLVQLFCTRSRSNFGLILAVPKLDRLLTF